MPRRSGAGAASGDIGVPTGGSQPYHHGSVREMLVREVFAQVSEGGVDAVSLRAAARRIGITHAAAYHHFADKTALIAAAAAEGMRGLAAALSRAEAESAGSVVERVCRIGEVYLTFALGEPAAFRLAFAREVAHKEQFPELRRASDAAAAPLLRSLQAWKGVTAVDDELRELAVALWSQVHGLSVLALDAQFDEGELRVDAADGAAAFHAVVRNAIRRQLAAR